MRSKLFNLIVLLTAINAVFFIFRNIRPFTFEQVVGSTKITETRNYSTWVKKIIISKSEQLKLKMLLEEEPKPLNFLDSIKTVAAIHSRFYSGYYGEPTYKDGISTIDKLYLNQAQLTRLYCDDITDGFILIAQELGLKCRQVNTVALVNDKWKSEHVLLEVWCGRLNKWIVSDPTTQTYLFKKNNVNLLSASELYNSYAIGGDEKFTNNDSLELFLKTYIRPQSSLAFVKNSWSTQKSTFDKIINYLTLETHFSYYGSTMRPNNLWPFLRLFFLCSWVFFIFLFLSKRM